MKRRPGLFNLQGAHGRRGSALLIVLALLSLLALMAATLAYTSKLDVISSHNFGDGVQRNMSAVSGIAKAAQMAQANMPRDAVGQVTIAYGLKGAGRGAGTQVGVTTETSRFRFADLSSRLNVNTAGEAELAALFRSVADSTGLTVNPDALAREIVSHRLGRDNAPGVRGFDDDAAAAFVPVNSAGRGAGNIRDPYKSLRDFSNAFGFDLNRGNSGNASISLSAKQANGAVDRLRSACLGDFSGRAEALRALLATEDDPAEYISDIRYPAFGDDRRFLATGQLVSLKGMTPEFFKAVTPYLTVFSVTETMRPAGQREEGPQPTLDLNRASAEEIYDALLDEYGTTKDNALLLQFAANIVDARDGDSIPTVLEGDSILPVLGVERVPLITEVYANSLSDDDMGDDGQYIEIYNPWSEEISLSGWTLRVGGRTTNLVGTIRSGGFLIVTDDYDNSRDPNAEDELPGTGSFYDIFGLVANGATNRVLEDSLLSIPNGDGRHKVELRNAAGDLMDVFGYRIEGEAGTSTSFQRLNVVVREAVVRTATPFALPTEASAPSKYTADRLFDGPRDLPFTSVLELFEVFAGYAGNDGAEGNRWGFPVLASSDSTSADRRSLAGDPTVVDALLVDIFTIQNKARPPAKGKGTAAADRRMAELWTNGFPPSLLMPAAEQTGGLSASAADRKAANAIVWARYAAPLAGQRQGLVNVNTASVPVLEAIGFSQLAADTLVRERAEVEQKSLLSGQPGVVRFRTLSALLVDENLWTDKTNACTALRDFLPVFDHAAVNSRAFLLEGTPLKSNDAEPKVSSGARVEALVAMDGESPEIVSWRFVH